MTPTTRALASFALLSALLFFAREGLAAQLEVTLTDGIPVVVTDNRIDDDPPTTAAELSAEDPGRRVAVATPISNVAATALTGANGPAGVGAQSETRGLEIVVDRFDPVAVGIQTGPNGEVRIPIVFTGGISLQNPGELGVSRQAISTLSISLDVSSRLTNPITSPEATGRGGVTLINFPFSREIRSQGFLQPVFPPVENAPAAVNGTYQVVLWAAVLPNTDDPADRTVSARSWIEASSTSSFDGSASRTLGRVDLALATIRAFFPVTTNPPTP